MLPHARRSSLARPASNACVLVLVLLCLSSVPSVLADDAAFLDGLRRRQLFTLAERYCRQELAANPSARRRADLAEELIRTLAQHASASTQPERPALWAAAQQAAELVPANAPRHLLVQTQAALAELTRAELSQQELAVDANTATRERALQAVRDVERKLSALNKELDSEIPARRRKPPADPDRLSGDELFALQAQIQYQLASALRTRAQCYPPGSDDRVAALHSSLEWSQLPLDQLSPDEPLVARIHLQRASCRRLLGDVAQAQKLLKPLLTHAASDIRHGAAAEMARLAIDHEQASQAMTMLGAVAVGEDAELDLVRLEAQLSLLAQAKQLGNTARETQLREAAIALGKLIELKHGAYWGRRASQRLISVAGGAASADVEIMVQQADELFRKGDLDNAIRAYEQAAAQARQAGDSDSAFDLYYKAALVAGRQQRSGEQASRLRRAALDFPRDSDAVKTHYVALILAAQLAKTGEQWLGQYESMLSEHASTWPDSEHLATVLLWMGMLLEQRGSLDQASQAFRSSAERKLTTEALAGFERCELSRLAALSQQNAEQALSGALAAAAWLEARFLDAGKLPAMWDAPRRAAVLAAARLYLNRVPRSHERVESFLVGALQGSPAPSELFRRQAMPLLVVAMAGQAAKTAAAEAVLKQLEQVSVNQLLETLDGLSKAMAELPAESRAAAAALQLKTIAALQQQGGIDAPTRERLERSRAAALAASGQIEQAEEAYRALAARHPKDANVQLAFARFLTQASRAEALPQWRRVAQRARPKTDLWYEAKLNVARQLCRSGKRDEAAELLRFVEAVQGLEGTQWQAAYRKLLAECGQSAR